MLLGGGAPQNGPPANSAEFLVFLSNYGKECEGKKVVIPLAAYRSGPMDNGVGGLGTTLSHM